MSPGVPQRTITFSRTHKLPVGLRARMRELSLGPVPWGSWSWTFQDGSCWAALCFTGGETDEDTLIGWAMLTMEVDILPVVGVFVHESCRGQGIGKLLVSSLLQSLIAAGKLQPGDTVYNSSMRWPVYEKVIESCGLRSALWV